MKKYLLDYKSWKTAVVESARLENNEETMQPLMEATVQDIQKLLPLAELGATGADGKIGPNTLAAIYKALSAAKPVVAPVGTGGTGGSGIVVLRYEDTKTITIGAGLTGSESAASGGYKRATITAGTGNVSWA